MLREPKSEVRGAHFQRKEDGTENQSADKSQGCEPEIKEVEGSKSPETKEEERQETAMARDCVIEIESESKEIKEEEVLVVDPLTTSEEMLLGMARAIIARNETQKKQAELLSKKVRKKTLSRRERMDGKRESRNSRMLGQRSR